MRKAGRLAALEQGEGGVLLHIEYKEEALEAMEEGQAVCEAVSQKAARGGVPHPLRRAENFPGPDRLDPGEAAPGGPVWDVSSLPGALEEILSVDLLEPEGLHDEGAGRAYALTAEPEFSSIVITSAALPWKGQTRTMAVTLFPNSAGQRITDDTAGPGSVQGGCAAAGSR